MENFVNKYVKLGKSSLVISVIGLILITVIGYFIYSLSQNISALKKDMSYSSEILSQRISSLEAGLATTTLASKELSQKLLDEQIKNDAIKENLNNISGTIGNLEKLAKTDKELLQKYSKVYFLSDNYVPIQLDNINKRFLSDQAKSLQFHYYALPFLERMLSQANAEGVPIKIVSAYRSFGTQSVLKNDYLITYGSGANKFSADQGYSEHQLGTTVDLTNDELKSNLTTKFEDTPAYKWLSENAYKYGFILSYPKDNAFYQYEPWHWRFIGVDLAGRIHRDGTSFSDIEQRDIDTFLINIFE